MYLKSKRLGLMSSALAQSLVLPFHHFWHWRAHSKKPYVLRRICWMPMSRFGMKNERMLLILSLAVSPSIDIESKNTYLTYTCMWIAVTVLDCNCRFKARVVFWASPFRKGKYMHDGNSANGKLRHTSILLQYDIVHYNLEPCHLGVCFVWQYH